MSLGKGETATAKWLNFHGNLPSRVGPTVAPCDCGKQAGGQLSLGCSGIRSWWFIVRFESVPIPSVTSYDNQRWQSRGGVCSAQDWGTTEPRRFLSAWRVLWAVSETRTFSLHLSPAAKWVTKGSLSFLETRTSQLWLQDWREDTKALDSLRSSNDATEFY